MKRVTVGKILTPHGVKGQFKLKSFMENPESIFELSPVYAGDLPLKGLKRMGVSGEVFIASLPEVNDRNAAEAMRNRELWISRDQLPETEDDSYYVEDLIGLNVIDAANGKVIGKVKNIENYGAGDVLEISFPNGKTDLLPFTKELLVEVDMKQGIKINMPEYVEVKETPE